MLREQSGRDENSLVADAMFVDAAKGDYRVKEGSPALALGFNNFPMDQFGVTSERLRRLARTPKLPVPVSQKPQSNGRRDPAHNQQFIPHDDRRQNNQRQTSDRDGRARGNAADDELQRRIEHRRQPEQEHQDADPNDAFEARQLRAQFAGSILLSRAQFGFGPRLFVFRDLHWRAYDHDL